MITSCVLAALVASPPVPEPPTPYWRQVNYDSSKQASDPEYTETLANLIYPVGKGPLSAGYPVEPLPVMMTLRGGNSNNLEISKYNFDTMSLSAKDAGMIGVTFNYPIISPFEDYQQASRGVGLLVQFLRTHHAELNVDPDRIVTQGRSFGAVVGYALALQEDFIEPGSSDPVLQRSSRPQYWIPRYGPSSMTCYSDNIGPWASILSTFFYPGSTFAESTAQERLDESPFWWLLNPHKFGRTYTPPMCVVSESQHGDTCGGVTDVHSGIFGDVMFEAMEDFAEQTGNREFLARSSTVDTSMHPDPTIPIILWAIQRMADDYHGLFMPPPQGEVGTTGGPITLQAFGAVPGSTVTFFTGTQAGTFPMPGCPDLEGQITDFSQIDTGVADMNGIAEVTFDVQASAFGSTVLFHAVDFLECEMSQVSVHRYY